MKTNEAWQVLTAYLSVDLLRLDGQERVQLQDAIKIIGDKVADPSRKDTYVIRWCGRKKEQ